MRQSQGTNLSYIETIVVNAVRNAPWMVSVLSLHAEILLWSAYSQDFHCIWHPATAHVHTFTVQDHIIQCIFINKVCNNHSHNLACALYLVWLRRFLFHYSRWDEWLHLKDQGYLNSLTIWIIIPVVGTIVCSQACTLNSLKAGNCRGISLCESLLCFFFSFPQYSDTSGLICVTISHMKVIVLPFFFVHACLLEAFQSHRRHL